MAPPRKVVLVDGSAMIFRAFFAVPGNLATATGLKTNAIFGFATMFRKLFAGRKPDLGAVVFDSARPTFRAERYPAYKAQRPALPDDLAPQLPWIDRVVQANGFPLVRVDGFEADDVIGTLAAQAEAAGMEVVIVSADKDFAQLVSDRVRMLDTLRDVTYDRELVQKKWGVPPEQIVDLLALMGDTSDNIPGVPGIGQKGAATLLAAYGSLDGIYARLAELKGRQRAALEGHRDDAVLSRELATIDRRVPLPLRLEELAIPTPDPRALNALYKELQFYSLLSEEARVEAEQGDAGSAHALLEDLDQLGARLVELAAEAGPVAVVPVFDPPAPVVGRLVGLAFAAAPGRAAYLPLAGDGPAVPQGLDSARAWLEDPTRPKIAHNAKELWIALRRRGVVLAGVIGDTMLASFLVEPTKVIPHRLEQLCKEYLQRALPPLKRLTGSGQKQRPLDELPVVDVGSYACALADAIAEVWPVLARRLDEVGLGAQLREVDLPLSWVLGQMELEGIGVDREELARIGEELAARLLDYEATIHRLAGREFNIGSTKQLAQVLFEELALPVLKKTKTGYSTEVEVLERLAPRHEIVRHLIEHRKLAKLINTYTDVLTAAVQPTTGRIHATFQQTVGATGRLISTDPDLQRTPVKTPEGKRIRRAFVAAPGCRLISADWSQIELRLLAHVSGDAQLVDAFRTAADVHRRTAAQLFGVAAADVTPAQRNVGKTINFATIYGQGATALGQILGIPRAEAQRYIDEYFALYAGVRAWLDRTIAEAHERGYVTTLFGRRRTIPELASNNPIDRQTGERIAANTPIQGSAADLCKLAMLRIAERLRAEGLRARMLLQIHDELVFEAPEDEVARVAALAREAMEGVWPLAVPLVVDVGVGATWADAA